MIDLVLVSLSRESQKFHFAGQLVFRKAIRKSGKSPVDFPGFLMAFLLIPYIVIFWAKFKPFLSYLIEYSRSLRTCSPRYQIIQYLIEYSSNLLDLLSFHQYQSIISRVQQKLEDLLSSIPDYSYLNNPHNLTAVTWGLALLYTGLFWVLGAW